MVAAFRPKDSKASALQRSDDLASHGVEAIVACSDGDTLHANELGSRLPLLLDLEA